MHLLICNGLHCILLQLTSNIFYSTSAGIQMLSCEFRVVLHALAWLQWDPTWLSRWGVLWLLRLCHASRSRGLAMRPPHPKHLASPTAPAPQGKGTWEKETGQVAGTLEEMGTCPSLPPQTEILLATRLSTASLFFRGCLNIT